MSLYVQDIQTNRKTQDFSEIPEKSKENPIYVQNTPSAIVHQIFPCENLEFWVMRTDYGLKNIFKPYETGYTYYYTKK